MQAGRLDVKYYASIKYLDYYFVCFSIVSKMKPFVSNVRFIVQSLSKDNLYLDEEEKFQEK